MLSRFAENLYWLGRYLERSENTARLLDVNYYAVAEAPHQESAASDWWLRILKAHECEGRVEPSEGPAVNWLAFDLNNPSSIRSCLFRVRENARATRYYLNLEVWEEINQVFNRCYYNTEQVMEQEGLHDYCVTVRQASHQINGIGELTMSRDMAFYFVRLGRYLERADNMLRLLQAQIEPGNYKGEAEVQNHFNRSLLRSVGALEAFRKIHQTALDPARIGEFLLLDQNFPRSVRFCMDGLNRALEATRRLNPGTSREPSRRAGKLASTLEYLENAQQVFKRKDPSLEGLLRELGHLHTGVGAVYFGH